MVVETASLPNHLAAVARRLNITGPERSADTFLMTSYLVECAIKTIAVILHAGLQTNVPEQAYRFGYSLVRADGLGTWERAIYESTTPPLSALLPPEFQSLLTWITKKRPKSEDDWFQTAKLHANAVLRELGVEEEFEAKQNTVRALLTALVQIRNKTKAHGAVGEDFFAAANKFYISAAVSLVSNCPAFAWQWMHLSLRQKGNARGVLLRGNDSHYMKDADASVWIPSAPGIYLVPDQSARSFFCGTLLKANRECTEFFLPNGGYNGRELADFIDYSNGDTRKESVSDYLHPPIPLPPSETHGHEALDVQANTFGNIPDLPLGYVRRKRLEQELEDRLLDMNHPVILLHGPGGVGKTCLALYVAHRVASEFSHQFEYIVWFSARDIDLRPSGPVRVRPAVADLDAISRGYGTLFGVEKSRDSFAKVLRTPTAHTNRGILFIFDNFETIAGMVELHKFLDTYTHLPNKVLITSREQAFKGDYPIEVRGMEFPEAEQMIRKVALDLSIEKLITDDVVSNVYRYTQGHAYVMRVIVGEIAKEKRYIPPLELMSRRQDIVDAVFERSFNKLSDSGRWVFLSVSNWKSMVSELALVVILSQRGLEAKEGIDECRRLSLITRHEMSDGNRCYSSPQLARSFGSKKLDGDPDRLAVQEDLEVLRKFGVIGLQEPGRQTQETLIRQFIHSCTSDAVNANRGTINRIDSLLESVANMWPHGWLELAALRKEHQMDRRSIEYALRRAVEEIPFSKDAWLTRARYAQAVNDDPTMLACFVSAVEIDPRDIDLLREAALHLGRYVTDHAAEIPTVRRGTYLASVRTHMERVADLLDATGLSRLAWLFLLEGDGENGRKYARQGLLLDPRNEHCRKILEREEIPAREYKKVAKRIR